MSNQEIHLCKNCYEVNKGFYSIKNGQKRCSECGGIVLNLQEAADHIAEQNEELISFKERYGE